jgi:hypothetical protein
VAAVVVLAWPGLARAATGCPPGGVDTSGMAAAEKQVGELRNDLATACATAQDNANNLHDDVFVVVGAVLGAAVIPSLLLVLGGRGQ